MQDSQIYNAIIISLIIGIIIVITTLIIARPEKESFTELYFNNHKQLPKYNQNFYNFSFTIHNLENKDLDYKYNILLNNKIIKFDIVNIKDKQKIEIPINLEIENFNEKTKIQVLLPEKDQEIHFWIENASCLEHYKPGIIEINAKGTPCCNEHPKLELRVNNNLLKEIEVKNNIIYFWTPELKSNDVIDLVFTNNKGIKDKTGKLIEDRNIFVNYIKINNKKINLLYDKNNLDCKDLKNNGKMLWNGAIRFRIK